MVFFYLTNAALDISAGVVWWVLKNTTYGVYNGTKYILYGSIEDTNNKNEILNEIKELKCQIKELKAN